MAFVPSLHWQIHGDIKQIGQNSLIRAMYHLNEQIEIHS